MELKTIILLLILITPLVCAEQKIISGTITTSTGACKANIVTTIEGTSATQQIDCNANTSLAYPVQITKDLTCTAGTIEKCDEKFSNLTEFMSIFGTAYNRTISEDFTDCIDTRETNQRIATQNQYANSTIETLQNQNAALDGNNTLLLTKNDDLTQQLARCTGTPKDCSEETDKLNQNWENRKFWWAAGGLIIGALACYAYYFRKIAATSPGFGLPPR